MQFKQTLLPQWTHICNAWLISPQLLHIPDKGINKYSNYNLIMFMNKLLVFSILLLVLLSGCTEENIPTTTTQIETTTTQTETPTTQPQVTTTLSTTTTEAPGPTTTTIMSKACRFLNFQIKSHSYKNETLTLYVENIGSGDIERFDVNLYFSNSTSVESFTNQSIAYREVEKYVLNVGPGLDNVTVVETQCGKSYFVNV
ncbi:MAG: hypothetical protein COY38_02210 [Candidatus Aenigmarchaeota archaeon CG_4_10_14_0_8_um_filter_37_24]|nr:hypothetical protein [Candidatus Aenigmarchaeota archaeon]OIN87349.1 MAG: hypothetical protein AUJ50_02795 [Candidatus Aenigmarchaeota archaeon CG1_02_38_14]PIV68903.1 MAG: hypothetical protein COS07_02600 [Candidatus Aenigmarchaeota archaeon CG01_land_8_20_14_3_00_37_9]PIW41387.1 MAG: hypothetical protein COW21_02130 [Candidatus Aenigmarchaeota archaeon CG15_BIG_FIL_POST_REV_8_21_14_020_37_27]PIX50637.1 MAG: hypothetical protein COZ52_03065 [Candidatus Aenigmarchaeota archaeon CG_4_8_14_3_u